jgi:hypothetical protein
MGRIRMAFARFMSGRYGTDKLNMLLLTTGLILSLVGLFVRLPMLNLGCMILSYGLLGFSLFRTFSRNTYKRYQENRKYLLWLQKIKDKQHRYYNCPRCRQQVRVPKGKGKISIICPKCKEKFVKKT